MKLTNYQEETVFKLITSFHRLLQSDHQTTQCIFKAPTGSGKTIMVAELLKRLSTEEIRGKYIYIWASLYDLHSQSKQKLADYLKDSQYNLLSLDELTPNPLQPNSIIFTNWDSLTKTNTDTGEWANVMVRDNERDANIISILNKTRSDGTEIILIVDEAHASYLGPQSQRFVNEVIQPKLTLEVSATPLLSVSPEDIEDKKGAYVRVKFEDVVASGLIKQETRINENIGHFGSSTGSSDEAALVAALNKRKYLKELYSTASVTVNPLLLIQLPSESLSITDDDKTTQAIIEEYLQAYDITYNNGKLALWLTGEKGKVNLEGITDNESNIEVLIFKQAVATGWDCPRAQVLVMLRDIQSITFKIQTVGRILRMPEARHYEEQDLNAAYVYTNISSINIDSDDRDASPFFKVDWSSRKDGIEDINLPSVYIHRTDYNALTADFKRIFIKELNKRFNISTDDTEKDRLEKADRLLELRTEELAHPLIANIVIGNLDEAEDEIGHLDIETIQSNVSAENIQRTFNYMLKAWSRPYGPVRSAEFIRRGFYDWFKTVGFGTARLHEAQRIIVCSEVNQQLFNEIIISAKKIYEKTRHENIAIKRKQTDLIFNVPERDQFGENYERVEAKRYSLETCLLRSDRRQPEKDFEAILERSESVSWWYKNGEDKYQYFAVPYIKLDEVSSSEALAGFYPDYIVRFIDGSIGIYDTKSGFTITDKNTYRKSDALQTYIKQQNAGGLKLKGGIVHKTSEGTFIYTAEEYVPDIGQWNRLAL